MNTELPFDSDWLWLIGAVVLAALELLAPGVFLLWIGVAAALTGLLALLFDLPLGVEFVIFAGLAVLSGAVGRRWYRSNPVITTAPLLNDRASQLVGQVVTAVTPIDPAGGRVRVGDSLWTARGGPAAVGAAVRVIGHEGTSLIVEDIATLEHAGEAQVR